MNFSICNYWKRKSQQQNSNPKIFQHLQLLKLERERAECLQHTGTSIQPEKILKTSKYNSSEMIKINSIRAYQNPSRNLSSK